MDIFNPPNAPEIPAPPKPEDPADVFRKAVRRRAMQQPTGGNRQALTFDPQTGVSVQDRLFTGGVALPSQTTSAPSIPTQLFPR